MSLPALQETDHEKRLRRNRSWNDRNGSPLDIYMKSYVPSGKEKLPHHRQANLGEDQTMGAFHGGPSRSELLAKRSLLQAAQLSKVGCPRSFRRRAPDQMPTVWVFDKIVKSIPTSAHAGSTRIRSQTGKMLEAHPKKHQSALPPSRLEPAKRCVKDFSS